jgi:hypothetical protein
LYILIFKCLDRRREGKMFWIEWQHYPNSVSS